MRRDDYFLMIASGILKLSDHDVEHALEHFGRSYELHQLAKPGFISIGGTSDSGQELPFEKWIHDLRKNNPKEITCSWASGKSSTLAPHIEAAFAGSQLLVLHVTAAQYTKTFLLRTLFSSQHEMAPEDFLALIDAQPIRDVLWQRINDMVTNHNQMNNRPSYDPKRIKEYLVGDGRTEFDFLSGQLIQETQIECVVMEQPFIIPEQYQHLFFKSDFFTQSPAGKSVFLYPLKDVSLEEVKMLIAAQRFPEEEMWNRLVTDLETYGIAEFPAWTAAEWPRKINSLSAELQPSIFNFLCRSICSVCEEKGIDRIIPEELKESFGPDELEHKRAQARGDNNMWFLEANKNPWEAYLFEQLDALEIQPIVSIDEARKKFIQSLQAIEKFAEQIDSPFVEAFRLGLFFLTHESRGSQFEEMDVKKLSEELKKQNFSEQALEQFQRVLSYTDDMKALQFPGDKMSDLLAVSISDVFGGMGSWNDQYLEGDQELFERLSADLFESLKTFFSSALSA